MRSEKEIIEFLESKGYSNLNESDKNDYLWSIYKPMDSYCECVSNERVPQYIINRVYRELYGNLYDSIEIYVVGQVNFCSNTWVHATMDFTVEEIFDNIDLIEQRAVKLWEAVNNF